MKRFEGGLAASALAVTAFVGILVLARAAIPPESTRPPPGANGPDAAVGGRLPENAGIQAAGGASSPDDPVGDVRLIAPDVVAPPLPNAAVVRRAASRPPLGELGAALPLELRPDSWKPVMLARPAITSSSEFRAGRYTVRIEGVEGVDAGRRCGQGQSAWPCGEHARSAFTTLTGRGALTCTLPRRASATVVTSCTVGRQDVGAWLVSNGWALALPDGPYVEAEKVARKAEMGIFGAAGTMAESGAALQEK